MRQATTERAIDYPVAVDNDYAIWSALANNAWPALYFIDTDGRIRDRHYGEGRYEKSERIIQKLLGLERDPALVEGLGVEAAADWDNLRTPETYSGSWRSDRSGHWALTGEWTIGRENVVLDKAGGSIAFRFHARDAHLVLSRGPREPIPFSVLLDGDFRSRQEAWTSTSTGTVCSGTAADPQLHGRLGQRQLQQLGFNRRRRSAIDSEETGPESLSSSSA